MGGWLEGVPALNTGVGASWEALATQSVWGLGKKLVGISRWLQLSIRLDRGGPYVYAHDAGLLMGTMGTELGLWWPEKEALQAVL